MLENCIQNKNVLYDLCTAEALGSRKYTLFCYKAWKTWEKANASQANRRGCGHDVGLLGQSQMLAN